MVRKAAGLTFLYWLVYVVGDDYKLVSSSNLRGTIYFDKNRRWYDYCRGGPGRKRFALNHTAA